LIPWADHEEVHTATPAAESTRISASIPSSRVNRLRLISTVLNAQLEGDRQEEQRKQAEESLQRSEARLSRAEEIAHIGHWDLDPKTEELTWSKEVYRLFGKDPKMYVPSFKKFLSMMHPEDSENVQQIRSSNLQAKKSFSVEYRIILTDGSIRHMQERIEISTDEAGNANRIFGTVQDITDRKQTEAEIIRQREELRGLAARLAEVEESERKQLARELHDQICQNLTSINIAMESIMIRAHKESLEQLLSRLAGIGVLAEQTSEIARNIMEGLRPTILDHYGLMGGLHQLGSQFSKRTGINIEVLGEDGDSRLNPNVELALFRIAQEALSNVAKYALATRVVLKKEIDQDGVRLVIADDGIGFDQNSVARPKEGHGWGLMTMSERAKAVGGTCRIESQPGQGTRVVVEVNP